MFELVLFFIPIIAIFSFLVGYFFRSSVSDWFFRKKTKTSYLDARSAMTGLSDSNLLNNEIVSRLLAAVDNLIEQQDSSVETKFEEVGNKIEQDLRALQKERNLFNQQQQEFAKRKDQWREQILSQVQIKVVTPAPNRVNLTPESLNQELSSEDIVNSEILQDLGTEKSAKQAKLDSSSESYHLNGQASAGRGSKSVFSNLARQLEAEEAEVIAKKSLVSTHDFYQQMKNFSVCYSSEIGIFQQILDREQQLNPAKTLVDPSEQHKLAEADSLSKVEFTFSPEAKERFNQVELNQHARRESQVNSGTESAALHVATFNSSNIAEREAELALTSEQEQDLRSQLLQEQEFNAKVAELLEALIAGEISDDDFTDIISSWQPQVLSEVVVTDQDPELKSVSPTADSLFAKESQGKEDNSKNSPDTRLETSNQGIKQLLQNYFQHLPLTHGLVVDDVSQLLELQLLAGLLHLKLANYPQAIKVFKYIIEQERWQDSIGVVQAKINLARCYQQLGFSSRAVSLLTALLGQTEFDGEIIELLLEIYITNQDWQQALALGKKYYNLDKSAKNRELLINLYLDRLIDQVTNLQPRQVLYALQRIIELDPNYRRSHVLRANYLFAQGDYLTALEGYQDSLNLSIDLLPSLIGNLAYCYKQVALIGEDLGTYLLELEQNYPEKAYIPVYYDLYISGYPFLRQKSNFEFANKIISSLDRVSLGVNKRRLQQGRRAKQHAPKTPNRRLINNVALLVRNNRRDLRVDSLAIRLNRLLELYLASKQDKVVAPFLYERIFDLFSLLVLSVPNLELKALLEAKEQDTNSVLTNWKDLTTPAELGNISSLTPLVDEANEDGEKILTELAKIDENHAWNLVQDYEQRLRNPYLYLQEETIEVEEEQDKQAVLPESQVKSLVANLENFLQASEQKEIQQSYSCKHCGYQTHHLFWRCPSCGSLNPAVLSALHFISKEK